MSDLLEGLPGETLVREGLADFQSGRCTISACLVGMAQPRLRRAGLMTGEVASSFPEPERQLYRLLRLEGGDAYSRYNALTRELVSFEQALDQRQTKKLKAEREREEQKFGKQKAEMNQGRLPGRRSREQKLGK